VEVVFRNSSAPAARKTTKMTRSSVSVFIDAPLLGQKYLTHKTECQFHYDYHYYFINTCIKSLATINEPTASK
jgi:hypothetical protein